jgi:two-component system sensor histidine kinase ChiS
MLDLVLPSIYIFTFFLIGTFAGFKITNPKQYIVGDNKDSTVKIVSAIFVSIIGLQASISLAERNFQIGLIAIFVTLGISINKLLTAKFVSSKLYKHKDFLTLGGVIESLYGRNARIVSGLMSLMHALFVYMVQALTIIYTFYYFFNLSPLMSGVLGLGSLVIYTSFGGVRGLMNIGLIQCLILIVTVPIIFSLGIDALGGYDAFWEGIPGANFNPIINSHNFTRYCVILVVFTFCSLDPITIQRIFICSSQEQSKNVLYLTGFIIIPFLIIAGLNGLLSLVTAPNSGPNSSLLDIISALIPEQNKGFMVIGLLAIVLSTADSHLNLATIFAVNDVILPIQGKKITPRYHVVLLRTIGFVLGIGGSFIVLFTNVGYELIYYAYKLWAPILIPLVMGLYDIKLLKNSFIYSCIVSFVSSLIYELMFKDFYSFNSIIIAWVAQIIFALIVHNYTSPKVNKNSLIFLRNNFFERKSKLISSGISYLKFTFSKSIFERLVDFSASRVKIHGAYYVAFGVFGTINYIIPYFVWTHETINDYLTLILRIIASILCFMLILKSQSKDLDGEIADSKTLPLYWHLTLLFCLPLMSTYTLLVSGFATTWLINATLSIFILVLLVDWITFIILLPLGFTLGYVIYMLRTGHLEIYFIKENLYLTIYLNSFALLIGVFFLYHKEKMIKAVIDAKNKLEIMNAELEDKVQKRTDTLKQALNVKTEFLNNISHEVRTPLQGITGISSELVEQWYKLTDEERFAYVKTVASNSTRLISLVSNLLDLSKFDSGKMLFHMEEVDLKDIIAEVIEELSIFNIKQDVEIKFIVPSINCVISADRNRIAQVIRNLLSNSIKFTDKGTITVYINHRDIQDWYKISNNGLIVSIKDMGPGIPEEELSTIFQPFTQSSRTKTKAGGTGLGLAISSEIVHAHNGRIWAENNSDKGATFSFVIPCSAGHTLNEEELKQTIMSEEITTELSNKKVLLVDDEHSCLISGSLILQAAGFEVVTADGGESALALLKHEEFCLIFLDLMMPDIYGLDVLSEIKNNPKLKKIPVILQTGASDNVEIAKAFSMGIAAYISKPYDKKRMTKIINEVLKVRLK